MKFLPALLLLPAMVPAIAGQVPGPSASADIAISHRDRFYTSDQFSNTVSVIDPATTSCWAYFVSATQRRAI
jgi:DNA-binding beta-propeller fold protein YncE